MWVRSFVCVNGCVVCMRARACYCGRLRVADLVAGDGGGVGVAEVGGEKGALLPLQQRHLPSHPSYDRSIRVMSESLPRRSAPRNRSLPSRTEPGMAPLRRRDRQCAAECGTECGAECGAEWAREERSARPRT